MHLMTTTVGDLHADLWEGLTITHRRVEGSEDVTVGEHAELGLCVVSHYGFEDRIEWFTARRVADPLDACNGNTYTVTESGEEDGADGDDTGREAAGISCPAEGDGEDLG